nr:PREDICTED: E3 ubiquitin-protein ligase Siah1-like [Bemisia tabaci]
MTSRGPVDRIVIDLEDDIPASVGQESAHDPLGVPESTRGKCKRKFDVTPSEIDYEPPQKERCVEAMLEMSTELECPVCMACLSPPIRTCWRGHGICRACVGRVKSCPLCSSKLNPNQNTTLDKLVSRLLLPCAFRKFGCPRVLGVAGKLAHENECPLRVLECPVSVGCPWRGKQGEMAAHLRRDHAANCTLIDYDQKITRRMVFSDDFHAGGFQNASVNSLIVIDNEVLVLHVKGRRERTQHYVLQSLGNDEAAAKFRYRLIHTSPRGLSLTYEGTPIPNNLLVDSVWSSNKCHRIPWELYENFFEPDTQDETLQIQIFRNETPARDAGAGEDSAPRKA